MEQEIVNLDLSGVDRYKLEAICNEALSTLTFGEVLSLLSTFNVTLVVQNEEGVMN